MKIRTVIVGALSAVVFFHSPVLSHADIVNEETTEEELRERKEEVQSQIEELEKEMVEKEKKNGAEEDRV